MDHVAIMRKSWGLLPKILSGQKTIESRWYQTKHLPWDKINIGDTVYFKNSGLPADLSAGQVEASAKVGRVLQFPDLNPVKVRQILNKYGRADGITPDKVNFYFDLFQNKHYCLLIFLKNPQPVTLFNINKKGFGAMSAWLTIPDINQIKLNSLV